MQKKRSLLFIFVFLVLYLVACNGGTPPSGNEESLEVNETTVSEDTFAEEIYINNCGNPARAEQISERSQTITVQVGADLGFNAKVVQGSVEGKYISSKGVTKSQRVEAAPYTNMRFILLWQEQISDGTVTASGHSGLATYRVRMPISVEQVSADDLGCNTPEPPPDVPPTIDPGNEPPTATTVSPPTYSCVTVNEQPVENSQIRRGRNFKVSFTVINNGDTVWPEDLTLDIASNPYGMVSAPSLPKRVPRVQPGDSIVVGPFDAKAPEKDGHYVISFTLGDDFCWPYVAFDVVK